MNVAVTAWQRRPDNAASICYAIDLDSIANGRANIEACSVTDEEMTKATLGLSPQRAHEKIAKAALAAAVQHLLDRGTQRMNRARRRQDKRAADATETVV